MRPQKLRKSQRSIQRRLRFERNHRQRIADRRIDRAWIQRQAALGYNGAYHYVLRGKETVAVRGLMRWARWFEKASRRVGKDKVNDIEISTVFLGIDHSYFGGAPLLFETMVFGGDLDLKQWRYETWDEARAGHLDVVCQVRRTFIKQV